MATVPLGPDLLCQEYQFLHLETYCLASIWDRHRVCKDIKCWQCYFAAAWHSERPWWELWRPLEELSSALPRHQEPTRDCSPTADPQKSSAVGSQVHGATWFVMACGLFRRKLWGSCASPIFCCSPGGDGAAQGPRPSPALSFLS